MVIDAYEKIMENEDADFKGFVKKSNEDNGVCGFYNETKFGN